MDFLKSLLVYMSLTMAASVQGAEAPKETPVPTVAPTAVVVVVETPVPGDGATLAPTLTPVPTEVPAPAAPTPEPAPTITPNRAYRNLAYGARGDDVRKVQQALVDLGYLTGNVDGAYGYQTRNAVRKFQEYNGLTRDGVAGRETQTRLLEDPAVVPNPERVTPSPVPTATPGPDGLVPQMEAPRSIWVEKTGASVLVNGEPVTAPVGVWQRGLELIVNVSDLAAAQKDMTLTAENAKKCVLNVNGKEIAVTMLPAAAQKYQGDAYCDAYAVTVNGEEVPVSQGDWMQEQGVWYATAAAIDEACHAELAWDEEENTMLIKLLPDSDG